MRFRQTPFFVRSGSRGWEFRGTVWTRAMSYLGEVGVAGHGRMRRRVCRIICIAMVIELVGGQEGFIGFV
jgi:hypothetical protein